VKVEKEMEKLYQEAWQYPLIPASSSSRYKNNTLKRKL